MAENQEDRIFVKKKLKYHTTKKSILKNTPNSAYGNIESICNDKLNEFNKIHVGKIKYENKLKHALKEMNNIMNKSILSDKDIDRKVILKDIIEECKDQINNVEMYVNETEFFFQNDAFSFLSNHFDNSCKMNNINNYENMIETTDIKNYMNYIKDVSNCTSINKFNEFILNTMNKDITKKQHNNVCNNCKAKNTINISDGRNVCINCGYCDIEIKDMDKTNFKDSLYENKSTSYQRMNHFSELLIHLQGKETTDIIKQEVYDKINYEIKKQGINKNCLTHEKLRCILKKLDYNQYFEHRSYIIYQIAGIKPPTFTHEIEVQLKNMFKEIQIPYEKHKPPGRKNFLHYDYVFRKFFELLNLDAYIKYLTELKSVEKKKEHDSIWKKICNEIRWEYIPSL